MVFRLRLSLLLLSLYVIFQKVSPQTIHICIIMWLAIGFRPHSHLHSQRKGKPSCQVLMSYAMTGQGLREGAYFRKWRD